MDTRFKEPYSEPRWWWGNSFCPVCFYCAHFYGRIKGKPRCKAFLDGIPREIIVSPTAKHDEPYPGDNGIRFEQYVEEQQEE